MESTQTRFPQLLIILGLVVVVQAGGFNCNISAFASTDNSRLLMCSLATTSLIPTKFSWYFVDFKSNLTHGPEINQATQLSNASFITVSATTSHVSGYFLCQAVLAEGYTTTCSLNITTSYNSALPAPAACCSTQPTTSPYEVKYVHRNDTPCFSFTTSKSKYTMHFIPLVPALNNLKLCQYPAQPSVPAPQAEITLSPPILNQSSSATPPPLQTPESVPVKANNTPVSQMVKPKSPLFSTTSTTTAHPLPQSGKCDTFEAYCMEKQSPCRYQNVSVTTGNQIKVRLQLQNFQDECQGVFLFTNASEVIFAVLFLTREEEDEYLSPPCEEDLSGEVNSDPTWIWVGSLVFLAVAAAVGAGVVVLVRRRRLLQNSRGHMRNKMVSTISGSRVHIFNAIANSNEEKSELEEFPRKHIRFLDTIGKGTFGTVVMAEALNLLQKKKGPKSKNWAKVAVKMTLISDKSNEELKSDFLCELALMKTIPPHVNIITLYASCTAHDPYLMIIEYAKHGDLRKYLLEHRMERNYANAAFSAYGVSHRRERHYASAACALYGSTSKKDKFEGNIYAVPGETRYTEFPSEEDNLITSRDLLSFALQICRGLEHLIRNRIVHRDVAARNVLLFDHHIVKISDFGLARKIGQGDVYERTRKGLLPIRWMSPESLFYNQFTEKSDVWSYGVLLWELITLGSTPYPGLDANTVLEKIRSRELLVCPPHSAAIVYVAFLSCRCFMKFITDVHVYL